MNQTDSSFNHFYNRWAVIQSSINIIGLVIAIELGNYRIWLIVELAWFFYYIINMRRFLKSPLALGYANWVTILRLTIVFVLSFSYSFLGNFVLFIGFLFAILLDGLDGYLARKFNQSSLVGECLDMECDAFLVLMLSWIHFNSGNLGWWILVPGGLRYFYAIAFFWLKQSEIEFPPKKVRSTIAVIFFFALILPFTLPEQLSLIIAIIASVLIILSFKASLVYRAYWHLKK